MVPLHSSGCGTGYRAVTTGDADSMEAIVTGATPATLLGWRSLFERVLDGS
jgi:hypothetical protein